MRYVFRTYGVCVFAIFLSFISLPVFAAESVYTELSEKACKVQEEDEHGSISRCPGIGGFQLLVEAGDVRESMTLVAADGKKHPLDLWSVVSGAPSRLGPKAEWRVVRREGKAVPQALIVRYIVTPYDEKTGGFGKEISYLAVAKITSQAVCVTDRIFGGSGGNEKARIAADNAAEKPCLE